MSLILSIPSQLHTQILYNRFGNLSADNEISFSLNLVESKPWETFKRIYENRFSVSGKQGKGFTRLSNWATVDLISYSFTEKVLLNLIAQESCNTMHLILPLCMWHFILIKGSYYRMCFKCIFFKSAYLPYSACRRWLACPSSLLGPPAWLDSLIVKPHFNVHCKKKVCVCVCVCWE